ncbi:MAG: T9SS type A sorting domain-containing protein [Bacteroidetes bacterium]|uniref:T9SS type A sorting domain-containing protein n=1 Tax=Phnomibacter sp. TaxID=2836217 RepID=UPI002FDD2B33|nr:T9SS type A sorting domain-containing protein [Bacteroidota bacterium]
MKNLYTQWLCLRNRNVALSIFTLMAFTTIQQVNAQVVKQFAQRSAAVSPDRKIYNIKGDFTMIGNTNLTLSSYGENSDNGNNNMVYVDIDGDGTTFNSSSANLTFSSENGAIPSCSNILFAGLYWTGRAGSSNTFSVNKTVSTPQSVNNTQIVNHNEAITNTAYTMSVARAGGSNNRYPRYTFSGNGNTVVFDFTNNSSNPITVAVNGGTATNVAATITTSNGVSTATLSTPYQVYSATGGVTIVVNKLIRAEYPTSTGTETNTQTTSDAEVNVSGTIQVNTTVTKSFDKQQLKLKGPAAAGYTTITASPSDIYFPTTSEGNMYAAYAEVTDYVRANGLGAYTVADMALIEGDGGGTGYFGGWGLVVVYENTKMKWRDVTVFDGYAYVAGSTTAAFDLPISGFKTVQTGPVNIKVGMMAGEGDRNISGDYFQIRRASDNTFVSLNHSGNAATNFFNSSIQTGGNTRNLNRTNNTGIDISMFNITNTNNEVIGNNATETMFRYGSTQDTYIIFNMAMSVDAYIPEVQNLLTVSKINGVVPATGTLSVKPGEEVEYKVDIKNMGTEAVNNYKLVIPIPYNTTFVPGSIQQNVYFTPAPTPFNAYFDPLLGSTGSVVLDFGTVPMPADATTLLADLSFKFKGTENCAILKNTNCAQTIIVAGTSSGTGATSGTSFNNQPLVQGFTQNGSCAGDPITTPLMINFDVTAYNNTHCTTTPSVRNFPICPVNGPSIAVSTISAEFPAGTRFYNSYPVTPSSIEYNSSNPFPATAGTSNYFAVPPAEAGCYIQFTITPCAISQTLTGKIWIDANGNRTVEGTETIPAQGTYKVIAIASNGPDAGKVMQSASFAANGTYAISVPANPVLQGGSTVDPTYTIAIVRADAAPSVGSSYSVAPTGAMGAAPSTGSVYYVTNVNDGTPGAGKFNSIGVFENVLVTAPYTTQPNIDVAIQSRPVSNPVFTNLPARNVGTFWQLDNDDQIMSGIDAEDGILETGMNKTFRLLSNPTSPAGTDLVIRIAYDANNNGPDAADILDASSDPDDNIFVNIANYDKTKLYVYFVSGTGAYNGSFTYTAVDAAGVGSSEPAQYSFTAILPINGLELTGSYGNSKGNLRWTIIDGADAAYYTLERSATANGFKQVAVVPANGNTYNYADDLHAFVGNDAYYRVKLVRKNGTVSYSNVISLKLAGISGLQLTPTMVRSDLQVRFSNPKAQDVSVRVLNMAGQVVIQQKTTQPAGNISINVGGLERMPVGTYTVQVFAGNNIQQGKIIVQH